MTSRPEEPGRKDLLKTAILKIEELKSRLEASASSQQNEPIAVVGMGCRFPNGANDPEAFWKHLTEGVDCLVDIPKDRWDIDDFYDPDPAAYGKMYVRRLGLIDNVRGFDPLFFRVSPREAAGMDPQQRIMLEVVWEALENSGIAPDKLAGSNTGVFIGVTTMDYAFLTLMSAHDDNDEESQAHSATGVSQSILSGRISYFLGLHGPCLSMDTACSSSVLAIHLACQSLRKGECTMALTGAINLILAPIATVATCKGRLLAPDGKCKVFDESADGYARAEGCGVLVLKTLRDAQANGDRILGVIRGTACNQDGHSAGITAPNGNAQREVIKTALKEAGLNPNQISYLEAHGTGTKLGDPIELQALGEVFGPGRPGDRPLVLGAVKASVGHMEPAAGMAGVIKVLKAFEHEKIPPQLHLRDPNHLVPWNDLPFSIPKSLMPWPAWDKNRRAGISCFGYSGTNTHMIVEAPPAVERTINPNDRPWHVLTLSAFGDEPRKDLAERYQQYLAGNPDASLADVCFTANAGRSHFPYRIAFVAPSSSVLEKQLQEFLATGSPTDLVYQGVAPSTSPKVAFLFTEEEVRPDLTCRLYDESQTVRQALERCDVIAQSLLGQSLVALLQPKPEDAEQSAELLKRPKYSQPALFALGYAYLELWITWGVTPALALGHGVGEIIAGYCAGVFGVEEGMRLAVERGTKLETATGQSANPTVTTFRNGEISQSYASPGIPLISTSLGRQVKEEEARNPIYWQQSAGNATKWTESVAALRAADGQVLLEIGHASAQLAQFTKHDPKPGSIQVSMFTSGENAWRSVVRSIGAIYCAGVNLDWTGFDRPFQRHKLALPTYPFQRQECWVNIDSSLGMHTMPKGLHPLVGKRLPSPFAKGQIVLEAISDTRRQTYLKDHRYFSQIVAPTSVFLEVGLAAAKVAFGLGDHFVEDLIMVDPLTLIERRKRLCQTHLIQSGINEYSFQFWSADFESDKDDKVAEGTWREHASGKIRRGKKIASQAMIDPGLRSEWKARCHEELDSTQFYDNLADREIEYGAAFQVLSSISRRNGEALATVHPRADLKSESNVKEYLLHPTILESAVQLLSATFRDIEPLNSKGGYYVPVKVELYSARPVGTKKLAAHASIRPQMDNANNTLIGNFQLYDEEGVVVAEIKGIHLKRRSSDQLKRQFSMSQVSQWIFETGWEAQPKLAAPSKTTSQWLIWADSSNWGRALTGQLQELGGRCTIVRQGETFTALPDGSFTCRPSAPDDFEKLIETISKGRTLPNVVFLAVADTTNDIKSSDMPAIAIRNSVSVMHLVQALARSENKEFSTFSIVTRGAQATQTPEELIDISTSSLWGLGRVLNSEIPDLHCRNIDLDPQCSQEECIRNLASELLATNLSENQIGLRQEERLVPRLVRWPQPGSVVQKESSSSGLDSVHLKMDGTYLITGGLGGLGLLMAGWMVEQGARRLILMGRSAPSATADESIRKLTEAGAEVITSRVDVADRQLVAEMLAANKSAEKPLRGIFHAAGILDDGAILRQDSGRFERVMAPKVSGAWNLHELTKDQHLDFFVMFSSSAALMGNPGQGSYSAGNTFIDALAHYRRAMGLNALSVNWGPWGSVGMAASLDVRHRQEWSAMGIEVIEPYHGLAALESVLGQPAPQVAVLAIDEMRLRRLMVGQTVPPFLTKLMPQRETQSQDKANKLQAEVKEKLQTATSEQRRTVLLDLVRKVVGEGFGFDPSRSVPLDQNLTSMGMDSLLAIHLTNRLKNTLDYPLPLSLTMEYPTIAAIGEYLYNTLPVPGAESADEENAELQSETQQVKTIEPGEVDPQEAQRVLAQLDQISESELDAMLASMPKLEPGN